MFSSSYVHVEAANQVVITGLINAPYVHIISNTLVRVEGSIKSQRSDCIDTELFHGSVG